MFLAPEGRKLVAHDVSRGASERDATHRAKTPRVTSWATSLRRSGAEYQLRLLARRTRARRLAAAGAADAVLRRHRRFQVYAGDVRQGRQPGEDVGELGGDLLVSVPAPQGGRQLADLLHEPHEVAVDTAAGVLGPE